MFFPQEVSHGLYTASTPEAEFKEKHGVWSPMPELTTPESIPTHLPWATLCQSRPLPYARVNFIPQGLWIWPQIWSAGGPTMLARDPHTTTKKLLSLE